MYHCYIQTQLIWTNSTMFIILFMGYIQTWLERRGKEGGGVWRNCSPGVQGQLGCPKQCGMKNNIFSCFFNWPKKEWRLQKVGTCRWWIYTELNFLPWGTKVSHFGYPWNAHCRFTAGNLCFAAFHKDYITKLTDDGGFVSTLCKHRVRGDGG